MRWQPLICLSTCLAVVAGGCRPPAPPVEPLRLAAASDLRQALPVLIAAFRAEHPGAVEFVVGSSGQLAEQIRQGAPIDLFLSANRGFVAKLAADGTIESASVQPYARGTLVLVTNPVFGQKVKSLNDLTNPAIKSIAIANTELAPYGIAAKQVLERLKLWDAVQPKLVPAESVHQALLFVQSGSAEVGFVSRALTDVPGLDLLAVPPERYDPIVQYLGVVSRSTRQAEAREFVAFLTGPIGQKMLVALGFRPVSEPTPTSTPTQDASPVPR